ncbi:MAG: TetR/AcrR family transcriptional regulator [Marinosulfonomonas sp.]|nr:TetR/AcrR family transcriptional regulator [Marinosulfonomonas sp.]
MSDLRERRKLRTANTIRVAAVNLVHAQGLDNVTTDMISEAAGISPRTFFNYFRYKEAALLPPTPVFEQNAVNRFLVSTAPILDDLVELIIPLTQFFSENPAMFRKLFEISQAHPKLVMLKINAFHEFEDMVRLVIAKRLKMKSDADKPSLIAALVTTGIRVAMESWANHGTGSADKEIERTFSEMKTIFAQSDQTAP